MALKLFSGKHQTKVYSTPKELLDFGHRICGVSKPEQVLERIATAMHQTLQDAKTDDRVPPALLASMKEAWSPGLTMA
jgi:serine/threonine-protein kinase HipA